MKRPLGYSGLAVAGTAAASLGLSDFRAGQLSLFLALAVLAVSLDLVWGYAGILSLGQLLPFGVAAYATARITDAAPSLSPVALLAAVALGAAVSGLVGLAAFRRRLSLVVVGLLTLMLSLTFEQIAEQWRVVTGGFNGLTGMPRFHLGGVELGDRAQDLAISVAAVVVVAAVGLLVTRPLGAVLIGIRDNERRVEALGFDTVGIKIKVFALGGAVAGLAGALYVYRTGFVSPGIFGFTLATNVVLWTLVGGRGTVVGPVLGTLVINFATAELADVWLQYWVLATGAIFIAAVVFVPDGLVPAALRLAGRPTRRSRRPALVSVERSEPPARASTSIIDARSAGKRFGSFAALDEVTLTMDQPELRCLIGPNGAGKSTLLDLLSGQQSPSSGEIGVFGGDLTGRPAWQFARQGVGRKFQAPQVIDSLSVAENLAVAGWGAGQGLAGRTSMWRLAKAPWLAEVSAGSSQVLEAAGLDRRAEVPAGDLSHGEKQWLEIAMAMAGSCRVLLLDEPTAGMTVAESLAAARHLRDLHQADGLPIMIVEHDMAFIRAVADRVTVLARGAVLADGTVAEVERDPQVQAVYLGSDSPRAGAEAVAEAHSDAGESG